MLHGEGVDFVVGGGNSRTAQSVKSAGSFMTRFNNTLCSHDAEMPGYGSLRNVYYFC
jgi:hypothetical protein